MSENKDGGARSPTMPDNDNQIEDCKQARLARLACGYLAMERHMANVSRVKDGTLLESLS